MKIEISDPYLTSLTSINQFKQLLINLSNWTNTEVVVCIMYIANVMGVV